MTQQTQKNLIAQGANGQKNTETKPLALIQGEAASGTTQEETKAQDPAPAFKPLTVEEVVKKNAQLSILVKKRETICEKNEELSHFILAADKQTLHMEMRDNDGNKFLFCNSEMMKDIITMAKEKGGIYEAEINRQILEIY